MQVLEQVYISQQNVDKELVNSIVWPAQHANAAESFYRIISGKGTPVNLMLSQLDKVRRCYTAGSCSSNIDNLIAPTEGLCQDLQPCWLLGGLFLVLPPRLAGGGTNTERRAHGSKRAPCLLAGKACNNQPGKAM